mmetsp:Transcript_8560/g.8682  ORF Transcript_8560/g.8682 Transcript_8560/m.8682 type:complete len:192 (+) Transcript_8560:376-951(+)
MEPIIFKNFLLRRFCKDDQISSAELYKDGFKLYHDLGHDVVTAQRAWAEGRIGVGGDMYDIYNSYKIYLDYFLADSNFWVASELESGAIVGCLGIIPSDEHENACELVRMSISESCRNQGVATKLLDIAVEWSKIKRFSLIHLKTLTVLTPAISLYTKYGFYRIHDEPYIPAEKEVILNGSLFSANLLYNL